MPYFSEYSERQKVSNLKAKKNDFQYDTYKQYAKDMQECIAAAETIKSEIWSARQNLVIGWAMGNAVDKILGLSQKFGLPWDIKGKIDLAAKIAKHIKEEAWAKFQDYELQSAINDLQSKQREIERYLTEAQRYSDEIDGKARTMEDDISRLSRKYDELNRIEGELNSLGFGDMIGFQRDRLMNERDRINREIRDIENSISRNEQFHCYLSKPC
jgi:hypothetical protein